MRGSSPKGWRKLRGSASIPLRWETNIVFFDVQNTGMTAAAFTKALLAEGVRMGAVGRYRVRAVTHLDVTRQDIERAIQAVRRVVLGRR
jgi:threonine aldolase